MKCKQAPAQPHYAGRASAHVPYALLMADDGWCEFELDATSLGLSNGGDVLTACTHLGVATGTWTSNRRPNGRALKQVHEGLKSA